jgi:hypothetical protein
MTSLSQVGASNWGPIGGNTKWIAHTVSSFNNHIYILLFVSILYQITMFILLTDLISLMMATGETLVTRLALAPAIPSALFVC